jgi:hypothetical protein
MSYRIAIQGTFNANLIFQLQGAATWIVDGNWAAIPHQGGHQDDPGLYFYLDGWRGHASTGVREIGIGGNELVFNTAYNVVDTWEIWLAINAPNLQVANMKVWVRENRGNGTLTIRSAVSTQIAQISPNNNSPGNALLVAIPLV